MLDRPVSLMPLMGVLVFIACRDTALPLPPAPGRPGSVSGRALAARPGSFKLEPVLGASVELLGSGLAVTTDTGGYFRIGGITRTAGDLLFAAKLGGEMVNRQRLVSLEANSAGPGRDIWLGDVELRENAELQGTVLLEDRPGSSGHAGTLVTFPQGPFATLTGDDGTFVFPGLPEGDLALAVTRPGYVPLSIVGVTVLAGQRAVLAPRTLTRATASSAASVNGVVRRLDGAPVNGATVTLFNDVNRLVGVSSGQGEFSFPAVPSGVYTARVELDGFLTVEIFNIAVLVEDVVLPVAIILVPTDQGAPPRDAGTDGGAPARTDAGADAEKDAGADAGTATERLDAGTSDAGVDAGSDAGATPGQLLRLVPFPAGSVAQCVGPGYFVQTGLDLDFSEILDPHEVASQVSVCLAPSVTVQPATAAECATGGVALVTWYDLNLDGLFEPGEATDRRPICNSSADAGAPDGGGGPPCLPMDASVLVAPFDGAVPVVDSIAAFRGVQGSCGFRYGYVDVAADSGFLEMTMFDESGAGGAVPGGVWQVDPLTFWTGHGRTFFAPNGVITSGGRQPRDHLAVRRWVSWFDGGVRLVGWSARRRAGGNGALVSVAVDGTTVYQRLITDQTDSSFSVDASVASGSQVDVVVDPYQSNDLDDGVEVGLQIWR